MSRTEHLLRQMTLAEKLGQLTMTASGYAVTGPVIAGDSTESIKDGSIGNLLNMVGPGPTHEMQRLAVEHTRLGIPLLIGLDIIHGHRTLFPLPIAETALFDPLAWEQSAREAAKEAAADGLAMTFAPMLDVSRDPRWGRTAEGPGEDPWVAQQMAKAKVRGFQGADLSAADALAACAKHFCAYGPVNAGREYAPVDISERTLKEVHLPGFEAAVKAGVATIMPAFTDLAGIPMSAHVPLLRDYLRGELGFDGVLVSDYNAIAELIRHGIAADLPEAAALALKAGMDIDMMADGYRKGLPIALERGLVTMEQIDAAVRRVLRLKERLGLFEDPYRRGGTAENAEAISARRTLARDIAGRAICLFKNERDALPLSPSIKRLALIGPLADAAAEMKGCWWGAGEKEPNVSVLAGLRAALPDTDIVCAEGVSIAGDDIIGVAAAVGACKGVDAILLCLGEATIMSGEAASRAYPELPGQQLALVKAIVAQAKAHNTPIIAVVFSGRPLIITELAAQVDAVLAAWFLGTEAGNAIADVVIGKRSPSGRTPMTWPRALGQVPLFFGLRPTGRPMNIADHYTSKYLDVSNEPLYPFGHGLTYGHFQYSNPRATPTQVKQTDRVEVEVTLSNSGRHEAEETVFLFTRDKVASVARPLLELRGVGKIRLKPGERGSLKISFDASELAFPGFDLQPVFEAGEVEVLIGPCADRKQLLSVTIELV